MIQATVMIPSVYNKAMSGSGENKTRMGTHTVPRRKVRRTVAILLHDHGSRAQDDEGNADTRRGDLVPLETGGLGLRLRRWLEGENAFGRGFSSETRATWKEFYRR